MEIEKLKVKLGNIKVVKLIKAYDKMQNLLTALSKRELPISVLNIINKEIKDLNAFIGSDSKKTKALKKANARIIKLLEKELKLVAKNYYRNLWMVLGMTFGIPFGTVFSSALNNYSFIGVGMPIGMVLGMAYGAKLDKKAEEEGRQLDIVCDSESI